MSQGKPSTVLLVEADSSLRRLVALGLQHRGMHVIEASSPAHILSFDARQVDLLVLDLDGNAGRDRTFLASAHAILTHPLLSVVPTILLAWEYPPPLTQNVAVATELKYLTKPFDARILHETIEQLLLAREADAAAYEARAEELLLATYSRQTAPSLWPIITAAGLLLAFIGMMLQIVITVVGVLIVAVALLLWTLGSRPPAEKAALA
jgi:DNA-binding NtrC family response regulator